jgi:hypothetical protein
MVRRLEEEWERDDANREAEIARRASLHPTERLAEDGAELRHQIEFYDDMIAVLEVSRSARASCRADDCFFAPRIAIQDEFRIRVEGVRGDLMHYRTNHYYHIICFEAMMDVEDMVSSRKFICDGGEEWGLIVRKWFQNWGQIDHEVLVKYIKDREDWERKHFGICAGMPPALRRVLFAAEKRDVHDGTEGVTSSSASGPETTVTSGKKDDCPVLQHYVSSEPWVGLSLLVRLPEIWAGRMQFMQDPRQPLMWQAIESWPDVYEGLELGEYGPRTEEEVNMEIEQHQQRLDDKRHLLRLVWEHWHAPAPEVPISSGLGDDDVKLAECVVESRKRSRSHSADGEESGKKRRKLQGDNDEEGET